MKINQIKFYFLLLICHLNYIGALNQNLFKSHQQLTSGAVYDYSEAEVTQQKYQSEIYHRYYNQSIYNPYHNFIIDTFSKLEERPSRIAMTSFDDLYDNRVTPIIWNKFSDLQRTLTEKRLSLFVKINLDWNVLYRQVGISYDNIRIYELLLLRFYNIIAKLYGFTNITNMVQSAAIDVNQTGFAKTIYDSSVPGIKFTFNNYYANEELIDIGYQRNQFATNSPIASILSSYGQALAYYAINSLPQRLVFNVYPLAANTNTNSKLLSQNYFHFQNNDSFHDVSESLINYLLNNSSVDVNDDPIKKVLVPLLITKNSESRMAWITNNPTLRDSFFSEALLDE